MAILVTGGAGYIGSHCCKILKEQGYDVVAVDNLSKGHAAAIDNVNLYIGNISDCSLMDTIFSENAIEGVMHFAAYSLVGESMEKPYEYYRNNVGESMSFFNSMIRHQIKNIVFSSTAATYGQPEITPITENSLQNPINTYGETKLAVEKMLKWFDVAYELKNICLRYFNVAGAHINGNIGEAHIPETHLIPIILEVANGKRDKFYIYGNDYETHDGTCIRDYIHVSDLIDAHIKAYEHIKHTGKSDYFNLGSGGGYSNLEILNTARSVTGHAIPAEFTARRSGDPPVLIASSEKAEKMLHWNRKYSIREIISTAWKWHSSHPDEYGI